jgi:hypothetical protein
VNLRPVIKRLRKHKQVNEYMNITTKNKFSGALLAVAITLNAGDVRAQDQERQQLAWESAVTVNDLAGKPGEHLGQVQLIGVVAAVLQGQGFVLVDKREYTDCGLTCLAEPGTKKIPVRWSGDAPQLEQTVRVAGILSQREHGLSFVAQEISIQ